MMNVFQTQIRSISLYIFSLIILGCYGYDRILDFDNGDCNTYEFYDLTQYQTYFVKWNGVNFGRYSYCITSFHGENKENVETSYRVCFKTLRYHFDCDIEVNFIEGLLSSFGLASSRFDCNTPPPDQWCTEDDYAKLKIIAKKDTRSRLELEVTVTADVSLSIAAALGIAAACIIVVVAIILAIVIPYYKKKRVPTSSGRIVQRPEDLRGTEYEGQQLIGYPTQQTIMVPHRGGYRPREITVQHTTMLPSTAQYHPLPSAPPSTTRETSFGDSNGRHHHYQGMQSTDQQARQEYDPSAPPPTYDQCMDVK